MTTLYPRTVSILCYEGDDSTNNSGGDGGTGNASEGGTGNAPKTFTQDEVNKFLAEDKRKHQERYAQLEASHKELLENQNLNDEQRDKLQSQLEDLQKAQRTKEQQLAHDKKQVEEKLTEQLKTAEERATHWENMFKTNEIRRSLQDAAVGADAFNPGHIVALLQPYTELKDQEGQLVPMVDFDDVDEKGQPIKTLRTPQDAVKRMRELPKIHGNLFKSNVVSGVGSGQADVGDGDVDYTNMSAEDYRKNRKAIKERVGQ